MRALRPHARRPFRRPACQGIRASFSHAVVGRASSPLVPGVVQPVSRDAGAFRGTLSNYRPWRPSLVAGGQERTTASTRSEDLVANDWAGRSMVDTITLNAVGANGLFPQSIIPAALLGLDEEQARDIGDRMESIFKLWCESAGLEGQHFADLQFMGLRSALVHGEMLHIPVMVDPTKEGGFLGLRMQPVHPERLCTPSDKRALHNMRDGVELDRLGRPCALWVAEPAPDLWSGRLGWGALGSDSFRRIPHRLFHRPGAFHCFRRTSEEQYRGEPILSPALKLFRHLADSLEYELIGQIVAASFPLFIKVADGTQGVEDYLGQFQQGPGGQGGQERVYHQSYAPGQVLYGNPGDDVKPLSSDRPGANWTGFVNFVVRAMGASAGIPYEALLKDFSKTNYSSARAALLEAWRVYMLWRQWQARSYCQPIYRMVIEEAYLRGLISLPTSAPGFYEALPLWTASMWIGPGRGYIDPVKEAKANISLIESGLSTYGEILGERGLALEDVWAARGYEDRLMQRLAPRLAARLDAASFVAGAPPEDDGFPSDDDGDGDTNHDDAEEGDDAATA